ncbi:MAG: hypothetical protein ACTTJ7_01335 [Treponema sp.]
MQRIHQKIIRTLFSACAVSMLLCACDSPNTPQSKPDPAPRPSPSPTPPSTGGSGGGSGTGSGSHGGVQNNQGHRDGGGVQADEGGSTVPSGPTTVKVTVKTIAADVDGHKKVSKSGGADAFEGELTVTVNKSPLEYGFVEDTVAELAKELKGKTAVLAAGEIYKFTEDDKGEKVVTAASLIGPSKTIYVSAFTQTITANVQSITPATTVYNTVASDGYTTNAAKETKGTVAVDTTPGNYAKAAINALKIGLAKAAPGTNVSESEALIAFDFYTAGVPNNNLASTMAHLGATLHVGQRKKEVIKITLKSVNNGAVTFNMGAPDPLSNKKVQQLADTSEETGSKLLAELKDAGKTKVVQSPGKVYFTDEELQKVFRQLEDFITGAPVGGVIGNADGNYLLFTGDTPSQDGSNLLKKNSSTITLADVGNPADPADVKLYVGVRIK